MQMILDNASKTDMIRVFSKLTLDHIIQEKYPSVGTLSRSFGLEKTEKVMGIIFHDLSSSFDGELRQDQVQEICAEISSSFLRNLSLEDVYLFCRTIKLSDQYGKLNINKVLKTLNKHMDDRSNAAYEYNLNQHLSTKFVDNNRKSNKEVMKAQFYEAKVMYMQEQQNNKNQQKE